MNSWQKIVEWINEHPTSISIFKYVLWVALVIFIIQFVRKILRKKMPETAARYKSQKSVEFVGYFFLIILTISYFTGNIKDFTLAIGLLSAGIAVTLQEIILSVAGSIYILIIKLYSPGDRIEINGIKGDVIDIDSVYTTMMEIGEWVNSDNYTGRIVKITNSYVFKGPIYNYTQDFPFIWDEISLPIHFESDLEMAKNLVLQVATNELIDYTTNSKVVWQNVVSKYYIEDAVVEPTLAITITDIWISLNMRYIVDPKLRRATKNRLYLGIYKAINQTTGKVKLSSTTMEIVNLKDLK